MASDKEDGVVGVKPFSTSDTPGREEYVNGLVSQRSVEWDQRRTKDFFEGRSKNTMQCLTG